MCVNSSLNWFLLTAGDAGNYTQLHLKATNQAGKDGNLLPADYTTFSGKDAEWKIFF